MADRFPHEVTRIAICGDWHADYQYAQKALRHAILQGVEAVLHVGDLEAWLRNGYLRMINEICEANNVYFMFVDGNHENHPWLNSLPSDSDGVHRLYNRLWHLPRGFRWEWHGVRFLALGGAYSVDRAWGLENHDWFPEETITITDAYNAVKGGKADVMLTHDCPSGVAIPGLNVGKQIFPAQHLEKAEKHRVLLRHIVNEVSPNYLWHGHYHKHYTQTLTLNDSEDCHITGLGMNGAALNENMEIVDVYTLAPWWIGEDD